MKLKPGVRLLGLRPEMTVALLAAHTVYGDRELVITSVVDSKHSRGSLHYKGLAIDLRTRNLDNRAEAQLIRDALAEALGDEFDVVLERNHLHIEYDPKTPL